jgi:chromosomal replication initiation ATPase DnaA
MSGSVVIQVGTATVVMTGIEFMQYGQRYLAAAEHLTRRRQEVWFDPLPYQLACQSLELHLKAFVWLSDRLSRNTIKNKYGHDLEKLWRHAKERNLAHYCVPTRSRDEAIALLSPYYKNRKFAYLDLSMSWEGIPKIRAHPKALVVVTRLCHRLEKALHKPVLNAS